MPPDPGAALAVIKSYWRERATAGLPDARRAPVLAVDQLRTLVAACALPPEPLAPVDVGLGDLLGAAAPPPVPVPRPQALVVCDQFLLVLGWAMMARRGELAALNLPDVVEVAQGLEVAVRQSKVDQHAVGRIAAIPYGGGASHETVRRTILGLSVPSRWETAEAVLLALCELAGVNPDESR
ncbi:hypothetical protein SAMN04489712_1343 [Thermomonospora echinospora]|uniref:Uncharacterized protein n=1 Tax=Thermomonospora echinospora TaxID=1992 RepID=A0A1H6E681_9ACTN|nr:hypothetical protein [Thermomonospora echinospora]SEG92464.1 hypothetical protein SAMN04489712_1343 [Thermomonospora echinospora]